MSITCWNVITSAPAVSTPIFAFTPSTIEITSRKFPVVSETAITAGPVSVRVSVTLSVATSKVAVTPALELLMRFITSVSESAAAS